MGHRLLSRHIEPSVSHLGARGAGPEARGKAWAGDSCELKSGDLGDTACLGRCVSSRS